MGRCMLLEESSTCLRITLEREQKPGQREKNEHREEAEERDWGRMETMSWGGEAAGRFQEPPKDRRHEETDALSYPHAPPEGHQGFVSKGNRDFIKMKFRVQTPPIHLSAPLCTRAMSHGS